MSLKKGKSDSRTILDLSKQVKLGSKSGILECLSYIKSDSKCCKQFVKDGGLDILVDLFRIKNVKILNVTLSVLANACIASDAREKVRGTKIAHYTVWILKNVKAYNALHCRACRLMGNLAECKWHARSLCVAAAIPTVTNILKNETNHQTNLMAIRAVRNIWSTYEGSREEILEGGVIKNIMSLLIVAAQKLTGAETKYLQLVEASLKAMCVFLDTMDPRCGDQMQGEHARGYNCIVELCKMKNKMAVRCLHKLCQIPECRPTLGSSQIFENLTALVIVNHMDPDLFEKMLVVLCLFSREAVNRAKLRDGHYLEFMLLFLKNTGSEQYHPMLLEALGQFRYDESSIVKMLNYGLLDVLVHKLEKMVVKLLNNREEKHCTKKQANESPSRISSKRKYRKISAGRYSLDYHSDNWRSCAGSTMYSPPSSPPCSFADEMENDENIEDNYSPDCSDVDWAENEEAPQEELESVKSYRSQSVDVEDSHDSKTSQKLNIADTIDTWTLTILSTLSNREEPIEKLADSPIIVALSAYINVAENLQAVKILTQIVKKRAYLLPLVKQGFVFNAQTLHGSEVYIRHLSDFAETGGAVGEWTSILLRGEESDKFIIAVSIPFLIKSRIILHSLLIKHAGLQLIFGVLSEPEHSLYENAIWSICQLANTLQIRPDEICKGKIGNSVIIDKPNIYKCLPKPATVAFELDDGTTIETCRKTLCQRSDAFSAMLEGNFSESGKRHVRLQNTTKEAFNTLILAINGAKFQDQSIESLLEAVLLADKFLMEDVHDILTESSISKLSYQNYSRAWNWARNNSCSEFKTCCVKMFLTTQMTKAERVQAFRDFSKNETFQEFLDEVRDIFIDDLRKRQTF